MDRKNQPSANQHQRGFEQRVSLPLLTMMSTTVLVCGAGARKTAHQCVHHAIVRGVRFATVT